ncbi:uncharacterized protein [Mytilus edulis]|uniref:uncharacterized protein n=1 Tax=Mytilus edulis TaxID=6550 RepID=UPI0039F0F5EC
MQQCLCQETTSTNQFTSQTSESPLRYQTSELMETENNLHTSAMQTEEQNLKTNSVNSTEKQNEQTSSETSTMYTTDVITQKKDLFAISTVFKETPMTFDRSKSTHHQTMQTLEQHPKTDITKGYSVKSTEKQRKQTSSETSTMYTSNFNTPESTSSEADSRDPIYTTIFKVLLGFGSPIIIIAVLTRLKGCLTAVRKIRHVSLFI